MKYDRKHVRAIQLQKYEMFVNQQKKFRKNLEWTGIMLNFAEITYKSYY